MAHARNAVAFKNAERSSNKIAGRSDQPVSQRDNQRRIGENHLRALFLFSSSKKKKNFPPRRHGLRNWKIASKCQNRKKKKWQKCAVKCARVSGRVELYKLCLKLVGKKKNVFCFFRYLIRLKFRKFRICHNQYNKIREAKTSSSTNDLSTRKGVGYVPVDECKEGCSLYCLASFAAQSWLCYWVCVCEPRERERE